MFWPLARTGNVATLSGGARLPRMRGPRIGGKGHQSPTTSPSKIACCTVNILHHFSFKSHCCDSLLPVSRLKALLCSGQTIVEPSPSLYGWFMIVMSNGGDGGCWLLSTLLYLPFSRGVPRWGQLFAMAKILPSRSAATSKARPSTSTGTRSPAAMSLDFSTATHSSCETREKGIKILLVGFLLFSFGRSTFVKLSVIYIPSWWLPSHSWQAACDSRHLCVR